ncbi:hypothetical protein [Mucilaginibacter sp. UYCu711]|uniref:hypothetical protein n=1 Tax=Mucilaginibacter sp. UYCu711 TaxID=3156339 RepID=UPI003D1A1FF3
MKRKNILTLLVMLIVLLTSCKKSESAGDTPAKKLKYLTQVISVQNGNTATSDYTYDDKKRLSMITAGTAVTTYTYNADKLFSVERVDQPNGFREVRELAYKDGEISSIRATIYRNNVLNSDITYNFLVVGGRITESHYEIYVDTYTYDSRGNVTKVYFNKTNFSNEYSYDDKPGRFTNGIPKYGINSDIEFLSPNNQVTRTNVVTTYIYGSDGYPTGATAVSGAGTSAVTTKYTYVYTEF